jgi:hypothetical protein
VAFADAPAKNNTPDSNYRIRTDCNGQLIYGTEGDAVFFKKNRGAQNISIAPFDANAPNTLKQLRWCGPGDTVEDGYLKDISLVDSNSQMEADCEVIVFSQTG